MLQLKNITKDYVVSDQTVHALRGISLSFRKSEFVSILGPSGCGKTTLLNIIGGLDRYTSGDIVINGTSTKLYQSGDWDAYRNHSIGFVFQSYNLIPHQTVLENVELALTLSGVDKTERKKRAVDALEQVGLKDKLNNLPAQLSGGQMQRVAIARAIVNNPEIILADEPTGALDTATSVQVMDILKTLAKDRLVIMVTHNPELARLYSTRIIKLKDGIVKDDSDPFEYTYAEKNRAQDEQKKYIRQKKPSMNFLTALSLSLKNLGTKKARTALTSFAGSIGIIGIALILSLSSGFNGYVTTVQKNVLSNYPVSVSKSNINMNSYASAYMGQMGNDGTDAFPDTDVIKTNDTIGNMLDSFTDTYSANDLVSFKKYLDEENLTEKYPDKISAVQYSYDYAINLYNDYNESVEKGKSEEEILRKINKIAPLETYIGEYATKEGFKEYAEMYYSNFKMMMDASGTWGKLLNNEGLVKSQYDLIAGSWPSQSAPENGKPWQLVVVVDEYNRIPDYSMYFMGLMTDNDVSFMFSKMIYNVMERMFGKNTFDATAELNKKFGENYSYQKDFKIEELIGKKYSVLLNGQYYVADDSVEPVEIIRDGKARTIKHYVSKESDAEFLTDLIKNEGISVEISGIIRIKDGINGGALSKNVYYTPAFSEYLIEKTKDLEVVKTQKDAFDVPIDEGGIIEKISYDVLNTQEINGKKTILTMSNIPESALSDTYTKIGMVDINDPHGVSIYPTSFENKDFIIKIIDEYNSQQKDENGNENKSKQIKYTDYVGVMMSSISTIINAITYVLIAFVSVSLVVSSIMIGVITYISVLERTKEIGILRSIGASKKDIRHVFNAETAIIGFISGALGIIITVLLDIPISMIINSLAGIPNVATLPVVGAVVLIAISIALTLIAGLIPAGIASKKDPVIALRSD